MKDSFGKGNNSIRFWSQRVPAQGPSSLQKRDPVDISLLSKHHSYAHPRILPPFHCPPAFANYWGSGTLLNVFREDRNRRFESLSNRYGCLINLGTFSQSGQKHVPWDTAQRGWRAPRQILYLCKQQLQKQNSTDLIWCQSQAKNPLPAMAQKAFQHLDLPTAAGSQEGVSPTPAGKSQTHCCLSHGYLLISQPRTELAKLSSRQSSD